MVGPTLGLGIGIDCYVRLHSRPYKLFPSNGTGRLASGAEAGSWTVACGN